MISPHYDGEVAVSGPWQERRDGPLLVRKRAVGPLGTNVYVLACARTRHALLVDLAAEPALITAMVEGFELRAAVQTHGHWDHVGAWDEIRSAHGVEVWGHGEDRDLFPGPLDRTFTDGDRLTVGDLEVEVLHLPGHTEGSVLFLVDGAERAHLLSGDTLFPGGHGRTQTARDHDRIMDGLEAKVFGRLSDDTWVYPGHGADTTLGAERPHLAQWRARGW